ncbi:Dual specificity protein kinase KNS1 [Spathaspora sp. JA1]|nr:Dual specificity protein kinase KNS1 [Spathaspora sp. JA1]
MSLITNRKRPRGFSETFDPANTKPKSTGGVVLSDTTDIEAATQQAKTIHLNFDPTISDSSLSANSMNTSPPLYHVQQQQQHRSFINNEGDTGLNTNLLFGNSYRISPLTRRYSSGGIAKPKQQVFSNPFLSAEEAAADSAAAEVAATAADEVFIAEEDEDELEMDGQERDVDDDDDDLIILEERDLIPKSKRNNSDSALMFDEDALVAYNMFNVNNPVPNFEIGKAAYPIKKQRTSSLPQLPQAKCFYNKLPNNYILQTPKLGNIKTNVIPHQSNLPPCDDENGHYIIKINEPFANRFIIIKLLGQGTFGKVVQCFDKVNREHVAIKIIRNIQKYRDAAKIELRILSTLKKFDNKNANHCIHLRECFDYRGHICIVTDLLKISLYDFLENNKFIPFPGSHIQAISKQLIRSVTFLHDLNLIHTDLKPENILLHDDNYSKKNLLTSTVISAYMKLGNSSSRKVPKYSKILKDPLIQVIDFGSAIFNDEYHSSIVSTRHYRAPEIVLGTGWSFPCDMWSIGCILVELIIGEPLFKTHDNLEHLAMIEKVCGYRIDKSMVKLSKQKENECGLEYFTNEFIDDDDDNRSENSTDESENSSDDEDDEDDLIIDHESSYQNSLLLKFPTSSTPHKFINSVDELSRIDLFISSRIGLAINFDYSLSANYEKNKDVINFGNFTFWWFFIDMLRKLFIINPQERIEAIDALNHPWFNLGIEDEGTL